MTTSGTVPVQDGKLYYEVKGKGHPLILIHAGFLDRRMWDEQFELFSNSYNVVRYDVRGFGRSTKAETKFSDFEDLHALLQHLKLDKVYIIGVSNGGRIAIDFTTSYQNQVDGLVLVGAGVSGRKTSDPIEDQVWKEFDKQMARQEDLIKQGKLKEAAEMDVNAWAAAQNPESRKKIMTIALENAHVQLDNPWKHQVSPDPASYKRLPEITVPTLVMIGDRDVKGMQLIANDLHSKIPGSKKVVVNGADHIVNMSRPEEFNRIVLEFLSLTHSRAS